MKLLKWINTIAFLCMVGVNIAANIIPIGGSKTGEISEFYPNLFTPAPVTFVIWGVIYFFLLVFVLYQWGFVGSRYTSDIFREKIGFAFAISCGLNVAWIFAWHFNKIELSVVFMVLLLVSLVFITRRIDKLRGSVLTFVTVDIAFDLYFGWIIAATIANVSVLLTKLEWNGFGLSEVTWTIIILYVGALIGAAVVIRDNRYISGLAIMWAYLGIIIKHLSHAGYNGKYMSIVFTATVGIVILVTAGVYRLIVPNKRFSVVSTN